MEMSPWRFVPLGLLGVCAIGMTWLIRSYWRRYGRSPVRLFRSGNRVQSAREAGVILLGLIFASQALATALRLDIPLLLGAAPFSPRPGLGAVVFVVGVSIVAAAILNMGDSWQMGFDQNLERSMHPGLVTTGLYSYSRNPIYLGLAIALTGWTLLTPSLLSVVILISAAWGVRRQAIEEEAHLMRIYGEDFRVWAHGVGRFAPGLGRLR